MPDYKTAVNDRMTECKVAIDNTEAAIVKYAAKVIELQAPLVQLEDALGCLDPDLPQRFQALAEDPNETLGLFFAIADEYLPRAQYLLQQLQEKRKEGIEAMKKEEQAQEALIDATAAYINSILYKQENAKSNSGVQTDAEPDAMVNTDSDGMALDFDEGLV